MNLLTDLSGETNPNDRTPQKKRGFIKRAIKFFGKGFLFFVKHKKKIKFLFNTLFLFAVYLIIKKVFTTWLY